KFLIEPFKLDSKNISHAVNELSRSSPIYRFSFQTESSLNKNESVRSLIEIKGIDPAIMIIVSYRSSRRLRIRTGKVFNAPCSKHSGQKLCALFRLGTVRSVRHINQAVERLIQESGKPLNDDVWFSHSGFKPRSASPSAPWLLCLRSHVVAL